MGNANMATGHMGDIYMDDNVDRKAREIGNKVPSVLNAKWIYLVLTLINGVGTYVLIKYW